MDDGKPYLSPTLRAMTKRELILEHQELLKKYRAIEANTEKLKRYLRGLVSIRSHAAYFARGNRVPTHLRLGNLEWEPYAPFFAALSDYVTEVLDEKVGQQKWISTDQRWNINFEEDPFEE